ncbi:unnamed protein product [Hermetia illucens]|uniref:Uncharacterized protein n=1 Tax=Hermetia illucens TaxID=343691 RepID=A0A7R8USQ0_HERIL|nr:unnamed protein product [Hermetia illucens]
MERQEVAAGEQDEKLMYREVSTYKEVIQPENANDIPKLMEEMVQQVEKRQAGIDNLQSGQDILKSQDVISQGFGVQSVSLKGLRQARIFIEKVQRLHSSNIQKITFYE